MCRLRNIAMHDYQESGNAGQTDKHTRKHGQTNAGQSYSYLLLCFAGDTKTKLIIIQTISKFYLSVSLKGHTNSLQNLSPPPPPPPHFINLSVPFSTEVVNSTT